MHHKLKIFKPFDKKEILAANKVMKSGVLSAFIASKDKSFYGGKKVIEFENKFKKKFQVKYAISVNSWTSGLIISIGALNLKPGDEVILSPWTMSACLASILHWNAIPIFADIDQNTFCIDPKCIEKKISKRTKAIMAIDIFGNPCDMKKIKKISKKYNLKIISDSAQAIGAKYYGKYAGTLADLGGYSFNYHKHINTGEGGMIVTNDKKIARHCQELRNHSEVTGSIKKNESKNLLGFNNRLTEIQAAIGIEQLKKLNKIVKNKQKIATKFNKYFKKFEGLNTTLNLKNVTSSYYVYPLKVDPTVIKVHKNEIIKQLIKRRIPIKGTYPMLHTLPILKTKNCSSLKNFPWSLNKKNKYNYKFGDCPVAESMNRDKYLGLNMWKYDYTNKDIKFIVKKFREVWKKFGLKHDLD